ncbi:MAG: polyketide cyclase/dehydrase and lipid transport [Chlamydiales bacterium]|nr:polyketide cyclase/dehydrase and lipid transport [Chlamydiales bacterium]
MIIANYSVITKAGKADIWPFYANLSLWPDWDEDVVYAHIDEPNKFICGARGIIKPAGGPKVKFELSEVENNKSFTVVSHLPLTKMIFAHYLRDNPDGTTTIIHQVEMEGLTSHIFAFIIGRKIKENLPYAMSKLVKLAESKSLKGCPQ